MLLKGRLVQDILQAIVPLSADPKERAFFGSLPADDKTTTALFNSIHMLQWSGFTFSHPTVVMPGQCIGNLLLPLALFPLRWQRQTKVFSQVLLLQMEMLQALLCHRCVMCVR